MDLVYPVKAEEDQKVFIDLDTRGDSPEDIVIEWHLEIRRFFGSNSATVGESKLVSIMKEYIVDVTQRAVHFEAIEKLQAIVDKHMEYIYWLYQDSDICFSDLYLDYMEHVMTFYLNLTLRVLLALKRKTKVTQKMVHDLTQRVIKRLTSYLLNSEYHIFHVLIRQTTTLVDGMIKDVLNILNSNICKQMFRNLYMHFLVLSPVRDMSDEAFCRAFILFENWKAFEDYKQNEKIEECLKNLFKRGVDCIKDNEFLKKILRPQASIMNELMKVVGCDPSITRAYFDHIKSKQKANVEILEDIGKLALEDTFISELEAGEDEEDAQYRELFNDVLGDVNANLLPLGTSETIELTDEQVVPTTNPTTNSDVEIINCDSDSDSDVEIVSIIPSNNSSSTLCPPVAAPRRTQNSKPKSTSFLESISVDVEAYRGNQISGQKEKAGSEINGSQTISDALAELSVAKDTEPVPPEPSNNFFNDQPIECWTVDEENIVEPLEKSSTSDNSNTLQTTTDLSDTETSIVSKIPSKTSATTSQVISHKSDARSACAKSIDVTSVHIESIVSTACESDTNTSLSSPVIQTDVCTCLHRNNANAIEPPPNQPILLHETVQNESMEKSVDNKPLQQNTNVSNISEHVENSLESNIIEPVANQTEVDVTESEGADASNQKVVGSEVPQIENVSEESIERTIRADEGSSESNLEECLSKLSLKPPSSDITMNEEIERNNISLKNCYISVKKLEKEPPDKYVDEKGSRTNGSLKLAKDSLKVSENREAACDECRLEEQSEIIVTCLSPGFNEETVGIEEGAAEINQHVILDTGQSISPLPPDTGQEESMIATCSQTTEVDNFEQESVRTISVTKERKGVRVEHCEFGYPTPPGSEEDADKDVYEQADRIYTSIPSTQPYNGFDVDRFHVAETTVSSEVSQVSYDVSVGEMAVLNEPVVAQSFPVTYCEGKSVEKTSENVSDSVNRTCENIDDYLSEDVDIDDRGISSADTELLDRLSDEEKNQDTCRNTNLGKSYEQIVKDAVGSQNSTDDENELDHVPQTSEPVDSLDDMEQFLKSCEHDEYKSPSPRSNKRRKGIVENETKSLKNSPGKPIKRVKINATPEILEIPAYDDSSNEAWNHLNVNNTHNDDSVIDETNVDSKSDRRRRKSTSPTKPKPPPEPLSKYRTRNNGNLPLKSLLKGSPKRVERKHSNHSVDDESDMVVIVMHQGEAGRGKRDSIEVKINRKYFTANKIPFNDRKLGGRAFVTIERLSANTLLVWERVTSRSRGNFVDEEVPPVFQPDKPMYKIVFDKNTPQLNSNDRKYYCEPTISDDTKMKNTNVSENEAGTVNSSTEIAFKESRAADDLPFSPCFSPSSNSSSEFSDPINLISYQDIERALQVVEPDDSLSDKLGPPENLQSLHNDSNDIVDNISLETIHLLSNNADFHKMLCDLDGEILIENVAGIDSEETENILNNTVPFVKTPKPVVCSSEKLPDELLSNLNSDEQLLKEVCQELESKALVDALQVNPDYNITCEKQVSSQNFIPQEIVDCKSSQFPKPPPETPLNFSNFGESSKTEIRRRLPKELLSINSQIADSSCNQKVWEWQEKNSNNTDICPDNTQELLQQTPQLPLPNTYIDNYGFHNTTMTSTVYPKVDQSFQTSRIGQPLICVPAYQKPSLIVNLPIPPESLQELSRKKRKSIQRDLRETHTSSENIPPPLSSSSISNSLNALQVLPDAVEILQKDCSSIVHHTQPIQQIQNDITSGPNIHIRNAFIFPTAQKKQKTTGRKRGRPPKNNKKAINNSPPTPKDVAEQPSVHYTERVPPIYHPEINNVSRFLDATPRSDFKPTQPVSVISENKSKSSGKITPLPMPVPKTFNFETDTLKKEVYKTKLELNKIDNSENEAEFETHLPLKKRKLSMPVPSSAQSVPIPVPTTESQSLSSSLITPREREISYPATPMLSIADVYIPITPRAFKTPAEKKQLPPDSPPVPICYDHPSTDPVPFTCSMNTFTSTIYHLNECPYNVKMDCSPYCPPPPVMFPPDSFSHSN